MTSNKEQVIEEMAEAISLKFWGTPLGSPESKATQAAMASAKVAYDIAWEHFKERMLSDDSIKAALENIGFKSEYSGGELYNEAGERLFF